MPLNFYELYKLLSENTVSQELKNLKKNIPRLSEDIIEAKKELKAAFLYLDIADKSLEALAKWMMFLITKSNWNAAGDFYLRGKRHDLTNVVIKLKNDFNDFIAYSLTQDKNFNPQLLDKFNNPKFKYEDLRALSDQYHDDLKKGKIRTPGRDGKIVLAFPDGYKWVDIKQGSCDIEAKSMGHCGNAGASPDDTLLSLRDNKNIPHLTFILNNGVLVERKGRANTKPKEKYHPYIIELLKLPIIKSLGLGRYGPENDFQLSDLKEEELENLIRFKPQIENSLILRSMIVDGKKIPQEKLEKVIEDTSSETDKQILGLKDCSAEIINLIYDKYKDESVCYSGRFDCKERSDILMIIASNHNTISETLSELYQSFKDSKNLDILMLIASNRNTEKSILIEIFKKYYPSKLDDRGYNNIFLINSEVINSIAENPRTPVEILVQIAKDDNNKSDWSFFIGKNPSTPKEILIDLFKKGRDTVLSNANVPEEVLRMVVNSERQPLSKIPVIQTKRLVHVAMNKNCPPDLLDKLSNDPDPDVQEAVVRNKNTSMKILEKMANDQNSEKSNFGHYKISDIANYEISQRLERQHYDQNP
jgi:hypothetical protein